MASEKLYRNTLIVTHQSYSDPLEKNLFKQPPTSSEIASFWTLLPSEFPLACRGGHACFLELHNTK